MIVCELKDIGMTYEQGKENSVTALHGITIEFEERTSYAITGESGSGKSTLMNIIAGLLSPTQGKCYFKGKDLSTLSDKKIC